MSRLRHPTARTALIWLLVTWWAVPAAWLVFAPMFWLLDGNWPEVRADIAAFSRSLAGLAR
jgi:hypothetical protein